MAARRNEVKTLTGKPLGILGKIKVKTSEAILQRAWMHLAQDAE
eukprot:CAMPEP_0114650664 /NCGR_PEP_ID=MMETSP0191-20121206/7819_1 /TAXON_ID=126664 /ORGANISM="Sorites sp." /LENGTH=43 /DNA_ID= /DNA_START= /DNA_END= /DNA_ORIENTATION=